MRKLSGYGPSLIVLGTAMLVLFLGPAAVQHLTYKQTQARMIQASHRLESNDVLAQINRAYADIATLVEPSVVHISAQQPLARGGGMSLSSGSGWVYDDAGHIVTNYHVVQDAQRIEVQLYDSQLREARMIGFDRSTDIAVLEIAPGQLHPAVRAAPDDPVEQGDLVFAFGSPFDFRFSMSSGVVSGKDRAVDVLGQAGYENFIQVDAAINPGNSGGPLTDFEGRVIGMNTAIATSRRGSLNEGQFAGIGLAIPLEMIEPVVTQIIEKGIVKKGFLGVRVAELDVNRAQETFGFVGSGVLIYRIDEDSPAEHAGVRSNDIVTHVNGKRVSSTAQLRSTIASMMPGDVAELSIYRPDLDAQTGEEMKIAVQLARLDSLRAAGTVPADQDPEQLEPLGIAKMTTSTPAAAARAGVPHRAGVLVQDLVRGSLLERQIAPGTTIVSVRDRPVTNVEVFLALLRHHDLHDGVPVGVVDPDGTYREIVLRVLQ